MSVERGEKSCNTYFLLQEVQSSTFLKMHFNLTVLTFLAHYDLYFGRRFIGSLFRRA